MTQPDADVHGWPFSHDGGRAEGEQPSNASSILVTSHSRSHSHMHLLPEALKPPEQDQASGCNPFLAVPSETRNRLNGFILDYGHMLEAMQTASEKHAMLQKTTQNPKKRVMPTSCLCVGFAGSSGFLIWLIRPSVQVMCQSDKCKR